MRRDKSAIHLFNYLDYRAYLKDLYREAKKSRSAFSFRQFSKKAGFASPNFLKLVMDGQRNLTGESLPPFMTGLGLNKQEQEFFRDLVFYNQSKTQEQANHYYQKLISSRKFSRLKPIEKDQYEYCSEWYHSVVRELILSAEFDGTPEWIACRIFPSVTPAQVKKSIEILEVLGFIRKGADGRWRQASELVTTGSEVASLALYNYHQNVLDLAKMALEKVPHHQRDVSSLTLGIREDQLPLIKKKIQDFRQEVLKIAALAEQPEKVVQLCIQMFPMTSQSGDKNCL